MNKIIKLRHIALIITVVIIAIGMAVGTICHFVSNGFFNYGDEFASYKSVTVTTSVPEDVSGNAAKSIAQDALSSLGAYEVSFSQGTGHTPNTVIYKFYTSVSDESLSSAVGALEQAFGEQGLEDATAVFNVNTSVPEGLHQLNFFAIAIASAVVFQAIYFAIRYKIGMALSSLGTQLAAVGVYASLLAITRCPVGLEAIAFAALTVVITMICNGVLFDKIKKSYKDEANAKVENLALITESAQATWKTGAIICAAAVIAIVVFGIFAVIASPSAATLAPFAASIISVLAAAYASEVFAPATYSLINAMDRRVK